jgi:hypothetical protein
MLKCPHDELTLRIASLSMSRKIEKFLEEKGEENFTKILDSISDVVPETLTRKSAEFHGITVDQLINSSNYEKLTDSFLSDLMGKIIVKLGKEIGLENKEAWALILNNQLQGDFL